MQKFFSASCMHLVPIINNNNNRKAARGFLRDKTRQQKNYQEWLPCFFFVIDLLPLVTENLAFASKFKITVRKG